MSEGAMKRTCGALRAQDVDSAVELNGWVNRRRDHGGLIFIDLRDRDGITQIVFDPQQPSFKEAEHLRHEDVIRVNGRVRRRPAGTENSKLSTGEIEVGIDDLEVLNRSLVPPFPVNTDDDVDENLRLEFRYLDLRRPRLQRNIAVRHRIVKAMRDFFDERGFLEIETPMLIKSTPEGARDYLVPSRVHHGSFYALPQSPQILKQILMIAGFGRYMQIARCMRDEDQRADRQARVYADRRRALVYDPGRGARNHGVVHPLRLEARPGLRSSRLPAVFACRRVEPLRQRQTGSALRARSCARSTTSSPAPNSAYSSR